MPNNVYGNKAASSWYVSIVIKTFWCTSQIILSFNAKVPVELMSYSLKLLPLVFL